MKSDILKEKRDVFLSLPESYHQGIKRYPLMIVLDGEDFFEIICGVTSYYSKIGLMPEMVVAGIKSGDRWRDYTPTHADIPDGTPVPTSGGGGKFFTFLRDELVPLLEKTYPLTPFRMIVGHSIAGLFSAHYLMSEGDFFSAAIATSPSLWWDHEIAKKTLQKGPIQNGCRLYLCIGGEGPTMESPINNMVSAIKEKKGSMLEYQFQKFPGIGHQSIPCHAMAPAFEYIFQPWRITGETMDSGLPAVQAHYKKLSAWMKDEIKIPEPVLNRLGYIQMKKGKIDEALEAFKLNIQLYPLSANVYDSMGEALMKNGQKQEAIKNFKHALKIDPSLEHSRTMLKRLMNRQ